MKSLEHTKLALLCQSKNRVLAAESANWEHFEQLDAQWNTLLEDAITSQPEAVEACREELMADNEVLFQCLKQAEKAILKSLEKDVSSIKSVTAYLK